MGKKKTIRGIFSRFSRDRLISDSSRSSFLCSNSDISRKEKRAFIQRTFSRFSPVPGQTFNLSLFETTNSAFFRNKGRVYAYIYIYISILLQATIPLITRLFLSFVYHTSRTKEDRLRETTCPYRKRGYEKREMCRARVERRRGGRGGGEQGKS